MSAQEYHLFDGFDFRGNLVGMRYDEVTTAHERHPNHNTAASKPGNWCRAITKREPETPPLELTSTFHLNIDTPTLSTTSTTPASTSSTKSPMEARGSFWSVNFNTYGKRRHAQFLREQQSRRSCEEISVSQPASPRSKPNMELTLDCRIAGTNTRNFESQGVTLEENHRLTGVLIPEASPDRSVGECVFCRRNGETKEFYSTHTVKDYRGRVICPVLRAYTCKLCGKTGDHAHTITHCPLYKSDSRPLMKTLYGSGRTSSGTKPHWNRNAINSTAGVVRQQCTPISVWHKTK